VALKRKVSKIYTTTVITAKRHETGRQLLLITNRKSLFHWYRHQWLWMSTLPVFMGREHG